MMLARGLCVLLMLVLGACARAPARCARPLDQIPEAPREQQSRRLVTSLTGDGCDVELRLPDTTPASRWAVERDAALATAQNAARSCCAQPRATNVADWPAGATVFDVKYECAAP